MVTFFCFSSSFYFFKYLRRFCRVIKNLLFGPHVSMYNAQCPDLSSILTPGVVLLSTISSVVLVILLNSSFLIVLSL